MIEMVLLSVVAAAVPQEQEIADTSVTVLTLEDAVRIALSENVSVKVADKEIERSQYAKKGTYASLFPQIDGSGSYQRTIKKQVMYMDGGGFDIAGMVQPLLQPLYQQHPNLPDPFAKVPGTEEKSESSNEGISVGRWNTWSVGVTASMPLVNAQLWKTLKISGEDVELAVEKARGSRLETVTQVKNAYFATLLAREAFKVYKGVYENALQNCQLTQKKYNSGKASELDLTRAKTTLANAIPNVYDAESATILALWQLKAVMGISLDENIDIAGSLMDYSKDMMEQVAEVSADLSLYNNSTMRQLAIQAEELADAVKVQQYAYIPSLAVAFSYNFNAMTNDFNFSEYKWTPYSYVGLSLNIPIFSGGKRLNNVRQAKVQAYELDLQRENTERQLRIAIRQYLNSMETAIKSFASAQDALGTAQKAYDIASKSYNVGRSTLTDLNDAQLGLVQTQLTVSQAVYNFVTSKAELEQILGADFTE
ncbi:MAG: TolC family protein [Bacteroidales bacterium]|nr:TolC family protein [Bacteroidales bacterium]